MEDTSGQLIATASVHEAYSFQYIVRRNLTPTGTATGSMNLVANQRRVGFSLLAGGLEPNADYTLVLNSTVVGTVTANDAGRILIRGWPANAPQVLEVRTLSLVDAGGSPVLSTALPR
jgi:hypothetical protein